MSPQHAPPASGGIDFTAEQDSPQFSELRSAHRRFVFPMTLLFMAWYLAYALLSVYAVDLMSTKVVGNVNLGLLLGLLQFVSTFAITGFYVVYANTKLDPISTDIRQRLEQQQPIVDAS